MCMTRAEYSYDSTVYYCARYYDPTIGRFISEDPIEFQGGINFYRYVDNRPTRFVDPTGNALTSVDAAMEQAIARGDIAEIQALLEASGDSLRPGMRQAAQIAVDNGSTTQGGAKSAAELAKHLRQVSDWKDTISDLEQCLGKARQKAKQAILDEIEKDLGKLAGELKEILQKWGLKLR
jgi:RHS repeat-associated protein